MNVSELEYENEMEYPITTVSTNVDVGEDEPASDGEENQPRRRIIKGRKSYAEIPEDEED